MVCGDQRAFIGTWLVGGEAQIPEGATVVLIHSYASVI